MDYSDEVLEETPERATKFLTGIGAVPVIRTMLFQAGMTDDDIHEGRTLLMAVLAAPLGASAPTDTDEAKAQRAAVAELDEWDEPNFPRHKAALDRRFPGVSSYVFQNLAPSTGSAAVQGIATLLERLDILEQGTDKSRAGTKKEDKKAVEFLGTRGLDKAERKRLKGLVDRALGPTAPLAATGEDDTKKARREKLVALRGWYNEWATTAKAVIKKRGYLIRLGLATRKVRKRKEEPAPQ